MPLFKFYEYLSKFGALTLYEKELESKISKFSLPKHVGIIMDGNRRLAKKLGENPEIGHNLGASKVHEVINWCVSLGIPTITLYAFSLENFERPEKEVKVLMDLFEREFIEIADHPDVHNDQIRVRVIGRREMLPKYVREAITYAENKTKNYSKHFVNFAIAYGGQQEIIDSVKKIAKQVKNGEIEIEDINIDLISKNLYTGDLPSPNPDLIIRTSGEERISNFLTWQSCYSELYFCETYWPTFRKVDLLRSIREYQKRERRYGK
ncbi:tritrans,polycis-undecaprenyl-diphosphate synthase [geranylgeranyl-diphosphate specific] [Methanococcus maripaludis]|uniref:Tritrans,polycis-undecaprenyl-diphosphate synthase (geranylgeranyl-diphosphate specific) n=1 Tax=Methanococcus maripaludis TaxID=39152 RepID=A0A7J9NLG1_METMI|nr:polyprenyl diphosphate synthase [Methanococcus maripaludis]MBA2839872.1 tritrans,polycis-undecaprenyl-diphosphate synthase [geranylgeranyl-diphosphate specific] [Methanococcus maripaludis]